MVVRARPAEIGDRLQGCDEVPAVALDEILGRQPVPDQNFRDHLGLAGIVTAVPMGGGAEQACLQAAPQAFEKHLHAGWKTKESALSIANSRRSGSSSRRIWGLVGGRERAQFPPAFVDLAAAVIEDDDVRLEAVSQGLEQRIQILMRGMGRFAEIDCSVLRMRLRQRGGDRALVVGARAPHRRTAEECDGFAGFGRRIRVGPAAAMVIDLDGLAPR
jgi:hypothetical protein